MLKEKKVDKSKRAMMRAESVLRTRFVDTDDSGSESDCSVKSSHKRVHFFGFDADSNIDNEPNDDTKENHEMNTKNNRLHRKPGYSDLKIHRGDIPDGSDLFRQVLKEIQTESDDECVTPRSDCSSTKPLKSILKRKSDL